ATPGTATPTTEAAPRGVPVDSSIPTGGCGSKRPRLLETLPKVQCIVRARIPTVAGTEMFLHLYSNDVDNKEHLAIVFGRQIRSTSLDAVQPGETEMDRMVRGAYTGRLFPGRTTSGMASGTDSTPDSASKEQGEEAPAAPTGPPLVRIHSECYTGETAWSARCDCGEQLDEAARLMSLPGNHNGGIIIYLRQEGRGIGLGEKLKAYNLQDLGSDTVEANLLLRHPADARSYGLATAMLLDLGQDEVRLLTNNPDKIRAVEGPNREVRVSERVAMVPLSWKGKGGFRSQEVEGYLKTKVNRKDGPHAGFGHDASLRAIIRTPTYDVKQALPAVGVVASTMSDKELRLLLLVRRHGVPEVKLVWNVPTGPDWTIAKLIAQVDEAIPLESGEWGLEDYAVELRGTDGEPFDIRSLLTQDIKRRRLSGRHQVSFDGKHLVDGLAFGRPWLRTPRDRPQVQLPPRKRARLTWDSDDDAAAANPPDGSDEDADRSPLLIEYDKDDRSTKGHSKTVRFHAEKDEDSKDNTRDEEGVEEDELGGMDFQSSSEDSDSESLMEYDEESLLEELRDIQEDHAAVEGDHEDHEVQLPPHQVQQISESPLQPQLVTVQAWIASLRISFPEKSVEEISQALIDSHYDTWEAYRRLDRQLYLQQDETSPVRPSNPGPPDMASVSSSSSASSSSDSSSSDSGSESDSDLDTSNKPPERLAIDSDEDSDDDSDLDTDDANDDSSSSDSSSDYSDSSSSDSEDSDDSPSRKPAVSRKAVPVSTIADGDLSENDDTVIRYPVQDLLATESSEEDSSNSDSSSDDSSSESEPEEMTSKAPVSPPRKQSAVSAPQSSFSGVKDNDQPLVPPGRGMRKTQKRNLRRRLAKKMASRDQSELSVDEPSAASTPGASKSREETEFLARKKALLDMMEVDKSAPSASPLKSNKYPESAPADLSGITSPSTSPVGAVENRDGPSQHLDATSSAASRRTKLNVDAGRRMLFGALGLRNPKTKADEEKLRTKLMKDVRPHINPRVTDAEGSQAAAVVQATEEVEAEDPDAWRQKINCSAVECCDEGIELSEPPFPFVQRWDPQQQYDPSQKKGKRKRPQRNASQFYQEEDSQAWKKQRYSFGDDSHDASYATEGDFTQDDIVLQYDDAPEEEALPAQKAPAKRHVPGVEDLPSLPADLSTLKDLAPGEAKPYMVITWKQWLLSGQTNWQPQLSNVTAVVVKVAGNDGADLRLLLAMRDRGLDKPEKTYDQGTGKRIYDKFEAPDMDEDEDEDDVDDGYRDVQFSELIEPKILLAAGTQKQDGWTDSVVRETQYEEGRDRDERLANGYEDQ
ncbi:hypothetical protein BN1708_018388, partial [Verticillium longisporum]